VRLVNKISILIIGLLPALIWAEMKVGYIDSNRIMQEYSEVTAVQAELEKEQRALEAEYNRIVNRMDSLRTDFDKKSLLYSADRRDEKQKEIGNLEVQIQEFQMEKFGPGGEIYKTESKLLSPVLKKIDAAIKVVGAERGYDYILDANSGVIVYALNTHDLTDEVLEELNKSATPTED